MLLCCVRLATLSHSSVGIPLFFIGSLGLSVLFSLRGFWQVVALFVLLSLAFCPGKSTEFFPHREKKSFCGGIELDLWGII